LPVIEILPDLFFIQRGFLNGNHFVWRGREPVLVDSAYVGGYEETGRLIAGLGVDLSRVRLIVNTHTHCDHIGGNHRIQERSGCQAALHRIGKHFIDTRDDWSTWWGYYGQEAEFFEAHVGLEDGDRIDVGPYEFEVLYTPGHASDGIVLYNRRHRLLFSGDALWEHDASALNPRVDGSAAHFAQLDSLDRMAELDIDRVFPGHGPPFSEVRKAIEKSKDKIRNFMYDPDRLGRSRIKKVVSYTLLMTGAIDENALFQRLMAWPCFPEFVDIEFQGRYRELFDDSLDSLAALGRVERRDGRVVSLLEP